MATSERLDFSQPDNELSQIAEQQRQRLIPKNDYKSVNPYSSTNKDAMADGDSQGKGTGQFLDTNNPNAGAVQDIAERKKEIVINEYQPDKPYTTPSA
jgi:hypothetical protein